MATNAKDFTQNQNPLSLSLQFSLSKPQNAAPIFGLSGHKTGRRRLHQRRRRTTRSGRGDQGGEADTIDVLQIVEIRPPHPDPHRRLLPHPLPHLPRALPHRFAGHERNRADNRAQCGISVRFCIGGDADEARADGGEEKDSYQQPAARAGDATVVTC